MTFFDLVVLHEFDSLVSLEIKKDRISLMHVLKRTVENSHKYLSLKGLMILQGLNKIFVKVL